MALIAEGVDTAKKHRELFMYKRIIERIKEVIVSTPANEGVFCAFYKILNDLRMNGIIPEIQNCGKELFIEDSRKSASENAKMLEAFKRMSSKSYGGAVLLGVCGGRNSEGEDYPGDFMNVVIIV